VHSYLTSGPWANIELSDRLKDKERHWFGPFRLSLSLVERQCGPEEEMLYREPQEIWDSRLKKMADGITDPLLLPPPIVNTMNGSLRNPDGTLRFVLADGTHRVESLKLKGHSEFWFVAWFETTEQLEDFKSQSRPVLFGKGT